MASICEENPDFHINFDLDDFDESDIAEIENIENQGNDIKKPPEKKPRFTELEETDLNEIVASAPSKNTNYNTKWGVSVFKGKDAKQ